MDRMNIEDDLNLQNQYLKRITAYIVMREAEAVAENSTLQFSVTPHTAISWVQQQNKSNDTLDSLYQCITEIFLKYNPDSAALHTPEIKYTPSHDERRNNATRLLERELPYLYVEWKKPLYSTDEKAFAELVGDSEEMSRMKYLLTIAANNRVNILLRGETGTGKNRAVKAFHYASTKPGASMLVIPCALIKPEDFEYEHPGLSAGTDDTKTNCLSWLKRADGGTLYFDEVCDLTGEAQPLFLHFLENTADLAQSAGVKEVPRIALSTREDLERFVLNKKMKPELYFRIRLFEIELPALRKRKEDIPLLAKHFVHEWCKQRGIKEAAVPEGAIELLKRQPWYGNILELRQVLENCILISENNTITEKSLARLLEKSELTREACEVDEDTVQILAERLNTLGFGNRKILSSVLVDLVGKQFTSREFAVSLEVAESTARTYLSDLTKHNLVRQFGRTKSTSYEVTLSSYLKEK